MTEQTINQAAAGGARATERFRRRREEILAVASEHINQHGAAGLTFAAVARELNLDTSSIVYYFRRKEQLVAACFSRSLDAAERAVSRAAAEPTPQARMQAYLRSSFDLFRLQRPEGTRRLATLSDMRALDGDARRDLDEQYIRIFAMLRGFFAKPGSSASGAVRAHILLANALWLFGWLDSYLDRDLGRVFDRLCDVLGHGLAPEGVRWNIRHLPILDTNPVDDGVDRFLHAATNLINEQGYRGASVEKIAASLGVTIGSFYHHLNNKDDLVAACCERSFALIERAQDQADRVEGSAGDRLGSFISTLLQHQFAAGSPLLRMSAFEALPSPLRGRMFTRANAEAMHIAGLIADGHTDGSIRPVDPFVAAQVIVATINAAVDLRIWGERLSAAPRAEVYAQRLIYGLLAE